LFSLKNFSFSTAGLLCPNSGAVWLKAYLLQLLYKRSLFSHRNSPFIFRVTVNQC
jgi:hypothetical protein